MNSTALKKQLCTTSIIQEVIYDDEAPEYERNVAIFVHTLSQGGSQRAVETLLKRFLKKNYGVFIFSPVNGVYANIFAEKYGASVFILDESKCLYGTERDVLYDFDMVIINSLCSCRYAQYYTNKDIPCVWWIHEGELVINNFANNIDPIVIGSSNFIFAFPWGASIKAWKKLFPDSQTELMPIEVEDSKIKEANKVNNVFKIFIPGSYQVHKGFHIALQAIIKLEALGISDYEATFCGYIENEDYYKIISKEIEKHENIKIVGEISKNEMDKYMSESDCVVIPSVFDAGPLTAIEALMHGKIVILSDSTGASDFVKDCENAFVFPNESVDELFKRLLLIYNDRNKLEDIRINGRRVYEKYFSDEKIDLAFEGLICGISDKK